jgi:hypothetical protein
VSGFFQISARVPTGLPVGRLAPLTIIVGNRNSQTGVTIAISASLTQPTPDGSGPLIDEKLRQLKMDSSESALPEIPTDRSPVPADWLALLSWNIQVGGTSLASGALRPLMVNAALSRLFTGTYQLLAAQRSRALTPLNFCVLCCRVAQRTGKARSSTRRTQWTTAFGIGLA